MFYLGNHTDKMSIIRTKKPKPAIFIIFISCFFYSASTYFESHKVIAQQNLSPDLTESLTLYTDKTKYAVGEKISIFGSVNLPATVRSFTVKIQVENLENGDNSAPISQLYISQENSTSYAINELKLSSPGTYQVNGEIVGTSIKSWTR